MAPRHVETTGFTRTVLAEVITPTIATNEVLPLALPNAQFTINGTRAAPHDLDLLRGSWPSIIDLVSLQGHLIQIPDYVPPAGRILDYDLALLVFAEWWLLQVLASDHAGHPQLDIRGFAPLVRHHPAKSCLMSLRGVPLGPTTKPHPLRAEWPDDTPDGLRWVTSRFRHLHKAGFVYMPYGIGDDGRRVYQPGLAKAGMARAYWIATEVLPADASANTIKLLRDIGLTSSATV